jgi:hypothetical protein
MLLERPGWQASKRRQRGDLSALRVLLFLLRNIAGNFEY